MSSWQNLEQTYFITDIMLKMGLVFLKNGLQNLKKSWKVKLFFPAATPGNEARHNAPRVNLPLRLCVVNPERVWEKPRTLPKI